MCRWLFVPVNGTAVKLKLVEEVDEADNPSIEKLSSVASGVY